MVYGPILVKICRALDCTVDDILEGNDDLFEDDIDRTSKKLVGERFDENIKATKEVEDFRKDLYEGRRAETAEKTAVDELIEAENIDIIKKDNSLEFPDIFIGATGVYYNLPVYTHNLKHFKLIKDITLYKEQ